MKAAEQTNVTQMQCVRTLKGRTFVDAKKVMSVVVKTVQVREVYDFKIFSKIKIMKCYVRYLFWDLSQQL